MQEQSCMVTCVYCTKINTNIGKDCPYCSGEINYFKPARMMDEYTSREEILNKVFHIGSEYESTAPSNLKYELNVFKDELVDLIQYINIYNFDLEKALIERIQQINENG